MSVPMFGDQKTSHRIDFPPNRTPIRETCNYHDSFLQSDLTSSGYKRAPVKATYENGLNYTAKVNQQGGCGLGFNLGSPDVTLLQAKKPIVGQTLDPLVGPHPQTELRHKNTFLSHVKHDTLERNQQLKEHKKLFPDSPEYPMRSKYLEPNTVPKSKQEAIDMAIERRRWTSGSREMMEQNKFVKNNSFTPGYLYSYSETSDKIEASKYSGVERSSMKWDDISHLKSAFEKRNHAVKMCIDKEEELAHVGCIKIMPIWIPPKPKKLSERELKIKQLIADDNIRRVLDKPPVHYTGYHSRWAPKVPLTPCIDNEAETNEYKIRFKAYDLKDYKRSENALSSKFSKSINTTHMKRTNFSKSKSNEQKIESLEDAFKKYF